MLYEIRGDRISAGVDTTGAELTYLRTADGFDYLWPGSPDSWNSRSPVLFPIIGGLRDNRYQMDGRTYNMSSHGFARRKKWTLKDQGEKHLTFQLKSDPESLAVYPFDFRLRITYKIDGPKLTVAYSLKNSGNRPMFFSLGGHPGFRCPLENGLKFDDYRLVFNRPEDTERLMKVGNLLSGETRPFRLPDGILPLRHRDYDDGAIILRKFASDRITLESPKGHRKVTVDFPGFPDLGIWTFGPSPAPFICIEPWFGVDSAAEAGKDGNLRTKTGIRTLDAGREFNRSFAISVI